MTGTTGEAMRFDDPGDDIGSNTSANRRIADVLDVRLSRRAALRAAAASTALGVLGSLAPAATASEARTASKLTFAEIEHGADERHHVAPGYRADVLIRWGDKVERGAPEFRPDQLTAAGQARQFGYNNDYIGYLPLPRGSSRSDHGLLVVNHEYTNTDHMFAGINRETVMQAMTPERVAVELAAHGLSIIEVRKERGRWRVVDDSRYARRITMETPFEFRGPAAGHPRLRTSGDPRAERALGTLNNCAGGRTPWGTVLSGEENFHQYFAGKYDGASEETNHRRYGLGRSAYPWWAVSIARFDLAKEPNEPNRFGWIVEVDPYDPAGVPVKRTALGRMKHEGAHCIVNKDGRVVVYMGDDEVDEYVYRFVSEGRVDPDNARANRDLLDRGTLSVARFLDDGTLTWLPLVHGRGPLTAANGFHSQADVLIETRRAADLLGATKMDRPEDVEPNPTTGRVYVLLTNNTRRKPEQVNRANPRANNEFGQILELSPPGGEGRAADHSAEVYRWDMFIKAGDPAKPEVQAAYNPGISRHGWFGSPDNCAFDAHGRLWIATDQGSAWPKTGTADGLWACETGGPDRALTRMFFRCPIGAELCGPEFTPDGRTLFVAVQHPSTDGTKGSSFETPATRWPDFRAGMPPRPSVVVITREDGREIGT